MLSYYFDIIDIIAKTLSFETISEDQFHTLFKDDYADIIDVLVEQGYIEVSGEVGERTLYITTKAIAEYRQEVRDREQQEKAQRNSIWGFILTLLKDILSI